MALQYGLYLFTLAVCVYLATPLAFVFFPYFMQHVFFLNFVRGPHTDYKDLKKYGFRKGRNFYVNVEDTQVTQNPVIGCWHIFPKSLCDQVPEDGNMTEEGVQKLVRDNKYAILVYLHGNSLDRAYSPRCALYKLFSEHDFHVLAIDYRGYGDSLGRPTELGVVADAKAIYKYAMGLDPNKPIFVWGHSMGSGVATRAVAELSAKNLAPTALVLEAPFNNLHDVVSHHPLSALFSFLPWFEATVTRPLMRSGLLMQSDKHIKTVDCPILVLHAQDDPIIPVKLGRKLVESARAANRDIKYVEFEASRMFLHSFIHRAEELPKIVMDFITDSYNKKRANLQSGLRQKSSL